MVTLYPSARRVLRVSLVPLLIALPLPLHAASTLDHIRQTQTLRCATNVETPEYSTADDHGPRTDFDASICRAVAIAIVGPSAHIILTPYPDEPAALDALHIRAVDL